tara:strand:- start:200 stop:586 length:387 start_codon:yes stop_codon:yes gene_type:complete
MTSNCPICFEDFTERPTPIVGACGNYNDMCGNCRQLTSRINCPFCRQDHVDHQVDGRSLFQSPLINEQNSNEFIEAINTLVNNSSNDIDIYNQRNIPIQDLDTLRFGSRVITDIFSNMDANNYIISSG